MTMEQVFAAFGELRPIDRFEIGGPLRPSFALTPVTSVEFSRLPVPTDPAAIARFLKQLDTAVAAIIGGPLSTWTLGRLVPGIASSTLSIETARGVTNRLVALVRSQGRRTWADLSPVTIGEIRTWHGAGRTMTARLVAAAAETALRTSHPSQLTLVYDAVQRSSVAAALDVCLAGLLDPRGRVAFELDDLRINKGVTEAVPPTHAVVGLGPDYVRRLKNNARNHVRAAVTADASLAAMITHLAEHLGEVVDVAGFEESLAALGLPGLTDPAGLLAVWLAGPYVAIADFDGWWSPRPTDVVRATTNLVASSGGVHAHETLIDDLSGIGVSAACAPRWLACQRVRIADGMVVQVTGRPRDVATRLLEATGRSMTFDELCAWLPDAPGQAASLLGELRRHQVFVETGPDQWELAEWGGEPSSHFVHIELPVTEEVVNGDEADVPGDFAALLGLTAGAALKLSTRFGPLVMSYDGKRVARGSARPVVLASGAVVGDVLSFVIDPRTHAVQVTVQTQVS